MHFPKKHFTQPRQTYKAGNIQPTRGVGKASGFYLKELLTIFL
jgi:hypothetical protein